MPFSLKADVKQSALVNHNGHLQWKQTFVMWGLGWWKQPEIPLLSVCMPLWNVTVIFLPRVKLPFPSPPPQLGWTCGLLWSGDQKIDMKPFWTKVFWDLTTPIRPSFSGTMSVLGEALNQGIHRPSASSTQASGLIFFRQLSPSCHQTSEGAWMTYNKTNRRTFCWALHSANCRDNRLLNLGS